MLLRFPRTEVLTDGATHPAPRPTPMSIFITERPALRARPVPAPTSREPGRDRQVAVRGSEKGPLRGR